MNIFGNGVQTGLCSFPESDVISYGIFSDGIYSKRKEAIGTFYTKVAEVPNNLGIPEAFGGFRFEPSTEIPKIPYGVFLAIKNFYSEIFKHMKSEVYSIVFWDRELQDFFIHIPKQTVSFASVKYEKDPIYFSSSRYIPVFESH